VGTKLKGLDQRLVDPSKSNISRNFRTKKKGLYAPLLPLSGAGANVNGIYITPS
jgi:hypothetical protein